MLDFDAVNSNIKVHVLIKCMCVKYDRRYQTQSGVHVREVLENRQDTDLQKLIYGI